MKPTNKETKDQHHGANAKNRGKDRPDVIWKPRTICCIRFIKHFTNSGDRFTATASEKTEETRKRIESSETE